MTSQTPRSLPARPQETAITPQKLSLPVRSTGRAGNFPPRQDLSFPESKIPKNNNPVVQRTSPRPLPQKPKPTNPFDCVPPHSDVAERCVLGSMLMARFAAEYAAEILTDDSFYHPRNRALFVKSCAVFKIRKALDESILVSNLKPQPDLEDIKQFIGQLIIDTPSPSNIEGYCSTLLEYRHERARLSFALRIIQDVMKGGKG